MALIDKPQQISRIKSRKFDTLLKIWYKRTCYKTVTKNYKGVNIISNIKIKVVSAVLVGVFCFSGAAMALAEEPTDSYAQASSSFTESVQSGFDIISSINNVQEKNDSSIKVSNVTANSAKLSWKSGELCNSYKVCRFNIIKNQWEEYKTLTKSELKLGDLTANTNYKYCVINDVTGELIGVARFTTAISKPKLTVKERDGDALKLGISKVQKGAKVELYRKKAGSKKYKKIATLNSKKKSYTDKDLKSATTYYYKAKAVVTSDKNGKKVTKKSGYSKTKKAKTLQKMGLPSVSGSTKTYAIYTAVTARSSPQYKLLHSDKCYTDEKTGIRMVDGCYCVALGSYYGTKIGTKYKITFSTGKSIDVILCDQKADRHTDSKHQYAVNNSDIVEFYVERSKMPAQIRNRGNYGILEQFRGSVVSIEKYI